MSGIKPLGLVLSLLLHACTYPPEPVTPASVQQIYCWKLRRAQRPWGAVQYTAGSLAGLSGVAAGTHFPADDRQARMWLGISSAAFAAMAAGATWLRADLVEQHQQECSK